jgi:hypothetical protein
MPMHNLTVTPLPSVALTCRKWQAGYLHVKSHMRNFVVFLQGENFNLEVDGKLQPAGFFAFRRIEAENEEEATRAVMAQLLKEPELEGKALPNYSMIVKVAHEMPLEHKNTYFGFTPYPMEEV